jgi:hypothetical protein
MLESATGRWVAYLRLEDPAGLSPITTVGRDDTVEEAQVATPLLPTHPRIPAEVPNPRSPHPHRARRRAKESAFDFVEDN